MNKRKINDIIVDLAGVMEPGDLAISLIEAG
jgi:hypothetical protein